MRRTISCAVLVAICSVFLPMVSRAAVIDDGSALPSVPAETGELQAMLIINDLRMLQQWHERRRQALRTLHIGRTLDDARAKGAIAGLWDDLQQITDVAAGHADVPVPATVLWFTAGATTAVQVRIKIQPGMPERLHALMQSAPNAHWRGDVTDGAFRFDVFGFPWVGRIDASGWLRISSDVAWLSDGDGGGISTIPLQPSQLDAAADSDIMLIVRDSAAVTKLWPSASELLGGFSLLDRAGAAVLTWKTDGDASSVLRLALHMPTLHELSEVARQSQPLPGLAQAWGIGALTQVQVTVQAELMRKMIQLASEQAEAWSVPWSDELIATTEALDGRIGFLTFDAPSDWAVVLGLRRGDNAQRFVTALHQWLQHTVSTWHVAMPDQLSFDATVDPRWPGSPLLHVRPHALLEGLRVVASGSRVMIISQKSRVPALMSHMTSGDDSGHRRGGESLLTPVVASVAETPALLSLYSVLGSDTTMGDWLTYGANSLRALFGALQKVQAKLDAADPAGAKKQSTFTADVLDALPLLVAVANVRTMLTYDMAFSLDVRDDIVVMQLAGSDL